MKKTIHQYYCDRCGEEQTKQLRMRIPFIIRFQKRRFFIIEFPTEESFTADEKMELCKSCEKEFREFIKK